MRYNEIYSIPDKNWKRQFRAFFSKPVSHVILFILTLLSTYFTAGWSYAFSVVGILFAHEMGHYIACKYYGVPATLPYFIPLPVISPFGTMGAVIRMRGFIPNRRALFDIGAAGPIAGFIVTLPILFIGLQQSEIVPAAMNTENTMILGESLFFKMISQLAIGPVAEGMDVSLHPMAYAGWVGLFVTALNLLPIGQLDGGHILYSMLSWRSRPVYHVFLGLLGVVCIFYPGWLLLFILLLWLGRHHPEPGNNFIPLDRNRRLLGYVIFLIFILTFTPKPFIF